VRVSRTIAYTVQPHTHTHTHTLIYNVSTLVINSDDGDLVQLGGLWPSPERRYSRTVDDRQLVDVVTVLCHETRLV